MKFTFKTTKATGRYRIFYSDFHEIKLKKKVIGAINDDAPHTIRLMVIKNDINEDGNPNCTWKWISLKKESKTIQEAKDFLNSHINEILKKHNVHFLNKEKQNELSGAKQLRK